MLVLSFRKGNMEMEKRYLSAEEVKSELLLLLEGFCNFLEKNNIKYTIQSGTMLGAVRHGGFIPWDDDIDLGLLRSDYNKLIQLLKDNNCSIDLNVGALGFELSGGVYPYIKIINQSIHVEDSRFQLDKYLWLDVFPFDGVPAKLVKVYPYYIIKILRKLLWYRGEKVYGYKQDHNSKLKKTLISIIKLPLNLIPFDRLMRFYIKQCSLFDAEKCEYVEDITWGTKPVPKILFDSYKDYMFENMIVKGLSDSDKYLTYVYGDYMKLPPEDKRINHGIVAWKE